MNEVQIPVDRAVSGRVLVPSSKSVTHRALLLGMLCGEPLWIERPLVAEDTEHLLAALRACGCTIEDRGDDLLLTPGRPAPERRSTGPVEIDCGASGTLLRLLAGVLSTRPGRWVLDGTQRLRERPLRPLVEALDWLGADLRYLSSEGHAPVEIRGVSLAGGRTHLDASSSSQFLSALLLAALSAPEPIEIEVSRLTSAPYVDLTLDYVSRFGGRIEVDGRVYRVEPGLRTPGGPSMGRGGWSRVRIEGDYSSAAYFAAAAALTGGDVRLAGLEPRSAQGDRRFLDLLGRMGATVGTRGDDIRVTGGAALSSVDVDMSAMPDQVPTLAALAPFARGVTRIRGAAHLRIKESDRLAAMVQELRRVGAEAVETPDGLEIPGAWAEQAPPRDAVAVSSHDDHRVAMSMAVLGLRRPRLRIRHPAVVDKSYPGFWDELLRTLSG